MRSRRGAVSGSMALVATALAVGAAACALVALGACGAFDATSDEASDGAPPSADATGDAQQPIPDAPSVDAPAELDAMGDGGCGHDFCADFDGPDAKDGWDVANLLAGGLLSIAPGGGTAGSALRSSIPFESTTDNQYAYVAKDFPNVAGAHIELDINVPGTALDASTVLTLLQFSGAATNESGVGIQLTKPSAITFFVANGSAPGGTPITTALTMPRDQWVHLVFDLRFGANQPLSFSIDGATAAETITTALPTSVAAQLRIGVQHYSGTSPAVAVLYDTVRVDLVH